MALIAGETLHVHFLGTSGSLPTISRSLPCILLKWGSHDLLFDCGEGSQRQMMRARCGFSIQTIFISHWHADHFLGVIGLMQTMSFSGRTDPLLIYGPDCVHDIVSEMRQLCRTRLGFMVESRKVKPGDCLSFAGYSIHVIPVDHGIPGVGFVFVEDARSGKFNREEAIGLGIRPGPLFGKLQRGEVVNIQIDGVERVIHSSMVMGPARPGRKVVYTGDTRPVLKYPIDILHRADLFIHDATFDDSEAERAVEFMHATAGEAGAIAHAHEARRLALFHFSTRYTTTTQHLIDAGKSFSGEIIAPEDLMMIEVPFSDPD